jgi:hypothetical protein
MTVFDPELWRRARGVVESDDVEDPTDLPRGRRRAIAERLLDAGWPYRQISSAVDIPVTTLHRWLADDAVADRPGLSARAGAWVVAGVVGACLFAIFRKGKPM